MKRYANVEKEFQMITNFFNFFLPQDFRILSLPSLRSSCFHTIYMKLVYMENPGLKERLFEEIKQQKESKASFVILVSKLLDSQRQVHIFHLQTKSFAEHKALQDYYDSIGDLVDSLVESFQGKYGIITGWKSFQSEDYTGGEQVITYLKSLVDYNNLVKKSVKDSYIQNQLDEVETLLQSTIYKLRFLK